MKKLYIKQKVFAFLDKFNIYNEDQEVEYIVEGDFTLLKRLTCMTPDREKVFQLNGKWAFLPTYEISRNGEPFMMIKKDFTFFKPSYTIEGADWHVEGSFLGYQYNIVDSKGGLVASIDKAFLSWGDFYELCITEEENTWPALAVVLAIDAATQSKNS